MPSWAGVQGDNPTSLQATGWKLNAGAQATGAFTMSGRGNFRLRDDDPKAAPVASLPFESLSQGTLSLRLGVADLRNQNGLFRLMSGETELMEVFLLNNEQGTIKTGGGTQEFGGTGWLNQPRDLVISWSGATAGKAGTVSVAFDAGTLEGRAAARVENAPFLAAGAPDGLRLEVGFGSAVNRTLLISKLSLKNITSALPDFSQPQIDHARQDFETPSALADWKAEKSEIALVAQPVISGKQSLRWSWKQPDAHLTLSSREAFEAVTDKSALGLWVYNSVPTTDVLRAELLDGKEVVGAFWFRLNFSGWRPLGAPYALVASDKSFDTLRFSAPPALKSGALDIDFLNTDAVGSLRADYQQPWIGKATLLKTPQKTFLSADDWALNRPYLPTLSQALSPIQRADLQKLTARLLPPINRPRGGLEAATLEALRAQVAKWDIRRVDGVTTGLPVLHDSFNQPPASLTLDEYIKFLGKVVDAFGAAKTPAQIEELRSMYLLLVDHWLESGWGEGSSQFGWLGIGYEMRRWSPYFLNMRDELQKAGRLDAVMKAVAWSMGNGREIAEEKIPDDPQHISTDILLNYNLAIPSTALALSDERQTVQRLDAFVRYLNYFFAQSGVVGPEGTVYHHWMHNILYGSYGVPSPVATYIDALMQTQSFRLDVAARERLRVYAENNAFAGFGAEFAPNMNPRAGVPTKWDVAPTAKVLADWGTPDGKQAVDPRMAALYLALNKNPDDETAKTFQNLGIQPFSLMGHLTLNGGVMAIQRRPDWLAVAVGMNQAYRGLEIYGWLWTNDYGRYARNGSVFVQSPNAVDGGYKAEGWNNSFWPGATSLIRPSAELFDYYKVYNNPSRMAGGTTLGANGIWGMDYKGAEIQFRKSAFFFDNRITIVTSGIHSDQDRLAVTTLYQSALDKNDAPTYLDGQSLTTFPDARQPDKNGAHWLMDNNGNGYYLAAGAGTLKVERRSQQWLYMFPKYLKDAGDNPIISQGTQYKLRFPNVADNEKFYNPTQGDFALTYLEHGNNPANAGAAYTVLAQTTPPAMASFAAQMADPQTAPLQIVRQDNTAHIVFDKASNTTGMVCFEPVQNLTGVVQGADQPCFIMTKATGTDLQLSLANTDTTLTAPIHLTLQGIWKLAVPTSRAKATAEAGKTTLEFTPDGYLPLEIQLTTGK